MNFADSVDYDKVARVVLNNISEACGGWRAGMVLEEVALTNRLIEEFGRQRRGCDVGAQAPIRVKSQVVPLHRRGERQKDAFGADIAITLDADRFGLLKTAFFQVKIASRQSFSIEKSQLEQAMMEPLVAKRAFVLAIDKERETVRLHEVDSLLRKFRNEETKEFSCAGWDNVTQWLHLWLACKVGQPSAADDPNSVEKLLSKFAQPQTSRSLWLTEDVSESGRRLPPGFLPAQVWIKEKFFA